MRQGFNIFNKYCRENIKEYGGIFGKYFGNMVLKMIIIDTINYLFYKVMRLFGYKGCIKEIISNIKFK